MTIAERLEDLEQKFRGLLELLDSVAGSAPSHYMPFIDKELQSLLRTVFNMYTDVNKIKTAIEQEFPTDILNSGNVGPRGPPI